MQNPVLIEEYRGGLLENIHPGRICVVGPDREVLFSAGDTAAPLYYRSSSKPLQALAPLLDGLDKKYGLTVRETALLCGSHAGEPVHVETLLSMLEKIGAKEEDLLMLPTYPANQDAFREAIRLGLPPRKAWHNCSGKHAGAMMLQKEAAGSVAGYWKKDSPAQQKILSVIAEMAEVTPASIPIGVDGCGVPVFAVPLYNMALSYLKLACPDMIAAAPLRETVCRTVEAMKEYPVMVRGNGFLCTEINRDRNIVAKGGAKGVYCLALRRERIGIALKFDDGTEECWPIAIKRILEKLGYRDAQTLAMLDSLRPLSLTNDNNETVGEYRPTF